MVDPTHLPYDPSYSNHWPAAALWLVMTRSVSTVHDFAVDFGARSRAANTGPPAVTGARIFLQATLPGQGVAWPFF